jgi:tetratricopeptide (TPR) repeat protein
LRPSFQRGRVEEKTQLDFGQTARHLARNPLGIIALFIVLVYGTAGLVFGLSGSQFDAQQKWALILFLVLFPVLVFFGFVWLVAKHSHRLYAPSDFRNDDSFVQLNKKLSVIEVRQQAAEVDPRGDSDSAFTALQGLIKADQAEAAKNLAKAFLKVERYEISLRMFDLLIANLDGTRSVSLMSYRAYSLIGLKRYSEALQDLEKLRRVGGEDAYDFWPRLGVAYCYFALARQGEFEAALHAAVNFEGSSQYRKQVGKIYPELEGPFAREMERAQRDVGPEQEKT